MKALVIVAALCTAGVAHAEPFRDRLRYEAAGGLRVGSMTIGADSMFGVGFHVGAGVRRDRLFLGTEYMFLSGHVMPPTDGSMAPADEPRAHMQRIGLDVRYSIGKLASSELHAALRGDFWVEAGVGAELVVPDRGDAKRRPDLAFGVGGQFTARLGDRRDKKLGIYYAVKATFARAHTAGLSREPTWSGPCDTATPPLDLDRTVMFNLGVLFGN